MVNRVTELGNTRLIQSLVSNTQDRIQDRQLQLSSMQKSQDYVGIANESSRLVTVEASKRRIDQFLSENTFINLRMDTTINSITSLKTSLKDMKNLVRDILDDKALPGGVDKDEISGTKMQEIEDFLNVKVNGRYIFAGSMTETKPVVPNSFGTAPTFDGSNTTEAEPAYYYKGDDTQVKARISEGVELKYGLTATDQGFEKLIRAVRIVRETSLSDANAEAKFQNAMDLLHQSDDRLTALSLNVGVKVMQLDKTKTNLTNIKNNLNSVIAEIERPNEFQAVTEMSHDMNMLQSSYEATVRLNSLSLANFL